MSLRGVGSETAAGRGSVDGSAIYAPTATMSPSARTVPRARRNRANARLELALSLSGVGLTGFMVMHLGFLFTVAISAETMDQLASFLERTYLLQSFAPFLVALFLGHVFVAARKVPTSYAQQSALIRHMRSIGHMDTWTWSAQVVTGTALLILASIHVWVILTDVPIEAAKSGARVHGIYLWFYIGYIVLVESHMSIGLYRLSVKWGLLQRAWAHGILTAWTVAVFAFGFAILVALYRIGGS